MSAPPDNWDDEFNNQLDDSTTQDRPMPHLALECCAICLDPRDRPDDMALLLPCRHRCDADCIAQWRARQSDVAATCPLCRSWIQRVVVGNEAAEHGAKLPLAGDDDSEWVADHHAPDRAPLQAEHEHAADADVVVIDIASERQLPGAPASRARRHRQPQVVSYIDHDDERDDDQLSKWCAVEDAMWERVQEATERRRREKNWLERD